MQKTLAREITCMVHSEQEYKQAAEASQILFGSASVEALKALDEQTLLQVFEGVPQFEIAKSEIEAGVDIIELTAEKCSVFPSKGEARKLIQGGGVAINKVKVADTARRIDSSDLISGKYIVVQKGKKNYFLIVVR